MNNTYAQLNILELSASLADLTRRFHHAVRARKPAAELQALNHEIGLLLLEIRARRRSMTG